MRRQSLFVGLGSSHGDDQIGWRVAEQLESRVGPKIAVHRAATPGDLLNWLDCVSWLGLCDACLADAPPGTVLEWEWPTAMIERVRFAGSHDLTLPAVLEIAAQLGRLPPAVTIWGVVIPGATLGESLSPMLTAAVPGLVERIAGEISHA